MREHIRLIATLMDGQARREKMYVFENNILSIPNSSSK
jgi:hypothetical protein